MAQTKVKALVIGTRDSKEKDKLVTLFSLESGKLFVTFKGVRGDKAKMKAAKELFTFGEFVLEQGKATTIVTEANVIDSFMPLRDDLEKYYEACSCLDIVKKICSAPDPKLFLETLKALKAIAYDNAPKYYALNKFLLSLFDNMGYNLNFDICSSCHAKLTGKKYLNLDYGEIVCSNCRRLTSIEVANETIAAMKLLHSTPYDRLSSLKLGGGGEVKALDLLAQNFEWRFGSKFFVA